CRSRERPPEKGAIIRRGQAARVRHLDLERVVHGELELLLQVKADVALRRVAALHVDDLAVQEELEEAVSRAGRRDLANADRHAGRVEEERGKLAGRE